MPTGLDPHPVESPAFQSSPLGLEGSAEVGFGSVLSPDGK